MQRQYNISISHELGHRDAHDILRMPIHDRILEIESLQVAYCSRLDFVWKSEMTAQLRYLGHVQFHQQLLLFPIEKRDIG